MLVFSSPDVNLVVGASTFDLKQCRLLLDNRHVEQSLHTALEYTIYFSIQLLVLNQF